MTSAANDTTMPLLHHGYTVRAPTLKDLGRVTQLIVACDIADYGEPDYAEEDVQSDWSRRGFDLTADAWLVLSAQEQAVGYAHLWNDESDAFVHPDHRGRGIGTALRTGLEARARQHTADQSDTLSTIIASVNVGARELLTREGYRPVQQFYQMWIDMEGELPAPTWPNGVTVRTFVPERDEHIVHEFIQQAFGTQRPYEQWADAMLHQATFDPSLWFLAMSGEEIVGAALCPHYPDDGWVQSLGVRPTWRGRGVGLALLRYAFAELSRRGYHRVGLGVDAANDTGATRLYERAGMRVVKRFERYQKHLA